MDKAKMLLVHMWMKRAGRSMDKMGWHLFIGLSSNFSSNSLLFFYILYSTILYLYLYDLFSYIYDVC